MIKKVEIKPCPEKRLLTMVKRDHIFSDDINVIWGRDASGKSIFLKALAAKTFIKVDSISGGWSKILKKKELENLENYNLLDMEWSSSPTFYVNPQLLSSEIHMLMGVKVFNGVPNAYKLLYGRKYNAFYDAIDNLFMYLKTLKKSEMPSLIKKDSKKDTYYNSYYNYNYEIEKSITNLKDKRLAFRKKYPKTKLKPTLLLDHIDAFFDLESQKELFNKTLGELSKAYQIIMVSNSVFALNHNIIALDDSISNIKNIF